MRTQTLLGLATIAGLRLQIADASPDKPSTPKDVVTSPLRGPFASRTEACAEAFRERGTCATYRVQVALPAAGDWQAIEIGVVADANDHRTTKHYGLFAEVGHHWFATFLGTEGSEDREMFPPCDPADHTPGSCAPSHMAHLLFYQVPTLSLLDVVKGGAKELVLFFKTPADVGFREFAPMAEMVQVCGLGADHVPSCTDVLIAVTRSRARVKSPADLFVGGELTAYSDEASTDGNYHPSVGRLTF